MRLSTSVKKPLMHVLRYHGLSSVPLVSLVFWASVSLFHNTSSNGTNPGFITVINIVIALYMGTDMESIISNPIGQPMATVSFSFTISHSRYLIIPSSQILLNSFGRKGTLGVWSIVVFVQ